MAKLERFDDFEVWSLGREICVDLEKLFRSTGLGKRYSLRNQMERSSGSILDNVAEGLEGAATRN